MTPRIDYGWRVVATCASFVFFGACGFVFSMVAFAAVVLWPNQRSCQRVMVLVIHYYFRAFIAVLQYVGVMTLEVLGGSRLYQGKPTIVVANHPTYLDVVVLLALTPSACCVVKRAHWRNPCLWGIVRAAKYVSNADALALVDAGVRQLAAGYTMIIFPEGTRSPGGHRLHAFSRGFAHMAVQSRSSIQPVLINCDPPVFTKELRWYHVPPRPFHIRVNVLDPIDTVRLVNDEPIPGIAARSVADAVEAHITQHLFQHGYFKTTN